MAASDTARPEKQDFVTVTDEEMDDVDDGCPTLP
eukprot:CAMPEP_0170466740 /NCGR_PEP_ID=MMETSP0123-20130129/10579_1 /TAXON_ID=182087 /ORGANISM="Favella ehrenbergii, Strain Fehren 1" /LENGTH=33 /DNA_ID= /DNA_START= /DNA_END= /DNA_ORIENTATION=